MKNHMSEGRAKKLVQCVGGRLVYLQSALNNNCIDRKDDEICKKVKAALFSRQLNAQKANVSKMHPESQKIIDELHKHGSGSTAKLIDEATDKIKKKDGDCYQRNDQIEHIVV